MCQRPGRLNRATDSVKRGRSDDSLTFGAGRDRLRSPAVGIGQARGAVLEQIGLARPRQEAPLGRRVRIDRAVDEDVSDHDPVLGERAADQQAASGTRGGAVPAR